MNNNTLSAAVDKAGLKPAGDRGVNHQDVKLTYDVSTTSLLLIAQRGAQIPLLLAHESDFTRKADSLGVSDESKIGAEEFDQKYVIRDVTGRAKEVLTSQVVSLVSALEPFTELELGVDMIRLLKKPEDEQRAVNDIQTLASLALAVSSAAGK